MYRHTLIYTLLGLALMAGRPTPLSGQTVPQTGLNAPALPANGSDLEKLEHVILEHENLLKKYPQGEFVPTVLMQLAQLCVRQSTIIFQQQMEAYEKQMEAFEQGTVSQEPALPHLSLQKAIDHLYRLVTEFPKIAHRDKALYMLATAHQQEGNRSRAQTYFEQIVGEFPESPLTTESHFRLGEYYFEKREYAAAIQHYLILLKQWNSAYFDMSLYKLGWSYYSLSDYANAIPTFIFLLEDMALIDRTQSQSLGKSKADLSEEAIAYIASCYTEFGGANAAKSFFAERLEKPYTLAIFLKMAELYQKRGYHPEAVETCEALLSLYPYYEKAPEIYLRIVENYEAENQLEAATAVRERAVVQFGPGGDWLKMNPQNKKALELAREELGRLGNYYQAEAEKRERVRYYQLAVKKYEEYLEKFPGAEDASRIQYLLAECFYALGDPRNAAEAYSKVISRDDTSRFRNDAAYNRILCFDQLLGADTPVDSVAYELDHFIGGNGLTVSVTRLSEIDLLKACNEFIRLFPDSPLSGQVLMKFAETLHEIQHYDAAIKVYKKVVDAGPGNPYYLTAAMNTGQCYFDAGLYDQADVWFSTVSENYPDSLRFSDKAAKLATLAKFKRAENFGQKGNSDEAATLLLLVAKNSQDVQLRDRALYDAAAQYQKMNKIHEAAGALEALAHAQPPSSLADEAIYKAAGLREMNEEWTLAAADYMFLAENHPRSPLAARALKNAALCHENTQDWLAAKTVYSRFVGLYPDSLVDVIECLCKWGEMALKTGDTVEASSCFQRTVSTYKKNRDRAAIPDVYYVAQAQFSLGEFVFAEYQDMTLKPPFDKSLKRKVAKFNEVFKVYQESMEYQVADWYTASSCRIGMCFEDFFNAFIDSPPPANLMGADLVDYMTKITETARPYKERAIETYQKLLDQAALNQIENTWVAESRKRLEALTKDQIPTPADEIGPEVKEEPANGTLN